MTRASDTVDTVVIGSGMGAMTTARLLQDRRGDRIIMIEAHSAPGGMTHEFERHGGGHNWSFASGLHYLGKPDGQLSIVNTMRYLTGDRIQWCDLPERYDIFDWGDGQIGIPAGHTALEAELTRRFPNETPAIRRYLRRDLPAATRGLTAVNVANSFPDGLRRVGLQLVRGFARLALTPTADVLSSRFRSPELRAILAFQWGDYGKSPAHTAFGFHATIAMHYANGATFPIGGPARIGAKTLDMIRQAGNEIRAGQRVTEILLDGDRAAGVRVYEPATGRSYTIQAKAVVSGIGARRTAELLPAPLGPRLQARLTDLGRNISCCILFLGLNDDPSRLGFDGANHWIFDSLDHEAAARAAPGDGPLYLSFGSLKDPAARHHSLEIVSLTDPAHFDPWAEQEDARTDPAYGAEKHRIAARMLERVERRHPRFADLVQHQELATPLTFGTYQRAADGAFYGLPASPARMLHPLASPRWPVDGLFLAGQDAMTPGILGAAAGGIRAAGVMLGRDKTASLITYIGRSATREMRAGEPWNGFLKVTKIVEESPTVTSFLLGLPDGGPLPFDWSPGQFLTVRAPLHPKAAIRSYSISSAHQPGTTTLRLTIKAQPGGLVSNWLHKELRRGDLIETSGPFGAFTFKPKDAGRLVLIAGGVGVTPFAAILDDLACKKAATRVTAVFGFRSDEEVLFKDVLAQWGAALPDLDLRIVLSDAPPDWRGEAGRIDRARLARLVPDISHARVHICGPEGLMQAMDVALPELGVDRAQIYTETFTAPAGDATIAQGAAIRVTFAKQNQTVESQVGASLLDIAQATGIEIPVVCGAGSCGACRMRLLAGNVKHPNGTALSKEDEDAGFILACQAHPQTDVTVDA